MEADGAKRATKAVDLAERYGARNYMPLGVVVAEAAGVWVTDTAGRRYIDMLSSYSALNFGHRHPAIIRALKEQADRVTLTSRAFHHERLGEMLASVARITGKERVLPMNTGAEAVETAIKAVRRWAYEVKGVPDGEAEIVVFDGNFHGRTVTITSFSSEAGYRRGFGPFTPGFVRLPYGDAAALERAMTPRTAAVLIEPIQGEAGIVIPPDGYLAAVRAICSAHRALLVADEIQTGLGRTGRRFACEWEDVTPDVYVLGKALGGGVMPVSAVAADAGIMDVFEPGSHGSTFGGNPLGCAVAVAALDVLERERLADRARELGAYFLGELHKMEHPAVRAVRGRGLLIGMELTGPARPLCERLMRVGVLSKETHDNIVRFAPPLVIAKAEIDEALERIEAALAGLGEAG